MATGAYPAIKAVGKARSWTIKPCVVVAESTGGRCSQQNVDGTRGVLLTVPDDVRLAAWEEPVRSTDPHVLVYSTGDAVPSRLPEVGHAVELRRRASGWWLPVAGHDEDAYRVVLRPVDGSGQPMGGLVYTFWFWAD